MFARAFRPAVVFLAAALAGACDKSPIHVEQVGGGVPVPVRLAALAPSSDMTLDGIVVSVSGPGIPAELVFDLGTTNTQGQAARSYDIPAGPARVFVARGFGGGVQTHESDPITMDVSRYGLSLDLSLKKLLGSGAINTTVEDFNVAVDDSDPFVAGTTTTTAPKGASVPFSVRVTHSFGARKGLPVPGVAVVWASENPGVVQARAGSCTTTDLGTCTISATVPQSAQKGASAGLVASYAGIAHRVQLTVE